MATNESHNKSHVEPDCWHWIGIRLPDLFTQLHLGLRNDGAHSQHFQRTANCLGSAKHDATELHLINIHVID